MLNLLDALDRLQQSRAALDSENRGWFALWAARSCEKAHTCLAQSAAWRRSVGGRFSPNAISHRAERTRLEALALVTPEYLSFLSAPAQTPIPVLTFVFKTQEA